jgi:hypothetical protein
MDTDMDQIGIFLAILVILPFFELESFNQWKCLRWEKYKSFILVPYPGKMFMINHNLSSWSVAGLARLN